MRRLGKYLLQHRIAVGGMGEIFRGKLPGIEGFEREVAIKKMLPHLSADTNFISMIIKEAKLTVLLNHPNIVQVFDLAKEGDEYYIAMEYVPGINVGTLLETCRKLGILLPPEVAIHITLNVLKGLAYAHDSPGSDGQPLGILHRDVTPQNILVTQKGWVKLTDFGIAKARNEISTTSPGMIKGKLGYIAPEQLTGAEPDHRIDIFCAGIVLWESLACKRLFKGNSEIDTFRLIAEAYVPLLAELRNDVTPDVEKVLHRALLRNPDERLQSCQEFYDALAQAIFPRTPDDYLSTATSFFAAHPELFASLAQVEELEDDAVEINEPTLSMAAGGAPGGAVAASPLPPVAPDADGRSTAVVDRARPSSSTKVPLILAAGLAVGLLGGAWLFRDQFFAPTGAGEAVAQPHLQTDPKSGAAEPVEPEEGDDPPSGPRSPPKAVKLKPLTPAEIQGVVNRHSGGIVKCLENVTEDAPSKLSPTIRIDTSGKVSSVVVKPAIEASVQNCLTRIFKSMRFRKHPDKNLAPITIPLTIKKS